VRSVPEGLSLSRVSPAGTPPLARKEQELYPGMVGMSNSGFTVEVNVPGTTELPGSGTRVITRLLEGDFRSPEHRNPGTAFFDLEKVSLPLEVRNRRSGDIFYPGGMRGRRQKVKDYFINRKIPRSLREIIPILSSPGGILWIIGWRTDERFIATEKSRKVLEVRVEECRPSVIRPSVS
jgi:tRNA(Ile)-lysidine synthase